jgi:hypothetical protein
MCFLFHCSGAQTQFHELQSGIHIAGSDQRGVVEKELANLFAYHS